MKRRLHVVALVLFLACLCYDVIVWGALPLLPDVGPAITMSARREAPLALTYIAIGRNIDAAVPAMQAFGARRLTDALGDGFARIRDDTTVAMDLIFNTTWNSAHRRLKVMYWATPFFLLLSVILWWRRPRPLSTLSRRP